MNFGLSDQELEFEFACVWKMYDHPEISFQSRLLKSRFDS